MQDVRVIGVESGALLLATDGGSEFRLPVTSALPGQVRQANPDGTPQKRVSPKDVQARIRGGADAADVAAALDVDVEYVRRFEGPVLAERAFILDAARRVAVTPTDDAAPDTFGEAITARLEAGEAIVRRLVELEARGERLDRPGPLHGHRGRARRPVALRPEDRRRSRPRTATRTACPTPRTTGIAPRLRAVEPTQQDTDGTRFDSGAFRVDEPDEDVTNPDVAERAPLRPPLPRIGSAQIEERAPGNETADLLEALRRRRGERESVAFAEQPQDESRSTVSVVDIPLQGFEDTADTGPQPDARPSSAPDAEARQERKKRSRRSMPSWDEIVFGTRPDDDMA